MGKPSPEQKWIAEFHAGKRLGLPTFLPTSLACQKYNGMTAQCLSQFFSSVAISLPLKLIQKVRQNLVKMLIGFGKVNLSSPHLN